MSGKPFTIEGLDPDVSKVTGYAIKICEDFNFKAVSNCPNVIYDILKAKFEKFIQMSANKRSSIEINAVQPKQYRFRLAEDLAKN